MIGSALIRRIVRVGLTLVALGLLVWIVGWGELVSALGTADWRWLVAMYLAAAGARTIEARQMTELLSRSGAPVRWSRVLLANSLSAFYSFIVPGDLVASGAKWGNLAAATGKRSLVLNAIIYNRLALLASALVAGAVALLVESPFARAWVTPTMFTALAAALVLILLLWNRRFERLFEGVVRWLARPLPEFLRARVDMLLASMRSLRSFRPLDHFVVGALAMVATAFSVVAYLFAFRSLGIEVPFLTVVWIHAVVVAVRQLPITIGGLGVREGALAVLLAPYGVGSSVAIALGFVLFTTSVIFGSVGGGYQFALAMGWARWGGEDQFSQRGRSVDSAPE